MSRYANASVLTWIDAAIEKPETHLPVLVVFRRDQDLRPQWARAVWTPRLAVSTDDEPYDEDGDGGEYDEATDNYYWPEGWYEWNECEETHWKINHRVTHWAAMGPLPAPAAEVVDP